MSCSSLFEIRTYINSLGSARRSQLLLCLLFFLLFAADSFGRPDDMVLLTVHDREISRDEFLYHFQKSNQAQNQQNVEEYLESFINFQLKLAQAREERFDRNIGFINELTEYRLLLAAPYLTYPGKEEGAFVEKLKRDWSFREKSDALEIICELADERVFKGNWSPPADQSFDEPLFYMDEKEVYQKDFIDFMSDEESLNRDLSVREFIYSLYQQFVSSRLITYENFKLEEKYPEFRFQLQEYRDAMLLLAITQRKVWSKAESENQDSLMKEWEDKLRATYQVKINEEVLLSLWAK